MNRDKNPRLSARHWIEIAVETLSRHGPDELTIDAMCRRAKKSKGSFYAHFASHDEFLSALVAHWRRINTEVVIGVVDEASPGDRFALLNRLAARLDARLDQGMRKLADRSPLVSEAVAEVDEMRIAYLARLYRSTERYSDVEASDVATLDYAAYVGLQQIRPRCAPAELERLYETFIKLLSRAA